jgi:hypothetical protein
VNIFSGLIENRIEDLPVLFSISSREKRFPDAKAHFSTPDR